MKSFIKLSLSAFACAFFTALLGIAFATNLFGVEISQKGLFPRLIISPLDVKEKAYKSTYYSSFEIDNSEGYTIKNTSDDDITIAISAHYLDKDSSYSISLNTLNNAVIEEKEKTLEISQIDIDNSYDYIILPAGNLIENKSGHVNIYLEEWGAEYDEDTQSIFETDYVTLKKGESYEIKLPL